MHREAWEWRMEIDSSLKLPCKDPQQFLNRTGTCTSILCIHALFLFQLQTISAKIHYWLTRSRWAPPETLKQASAAVLLFLAAQIGKGSILNKSWRHQCYKPLGARQTLNPSCQHEFPWTFPLQTKPLFASSCERLLFYCINLCRTRKGIRINASITSVYIQC